MSQTAQTVYLTSAVAIGGTFTVGYPPGFSRANYYRGVQAVIRVYNAKYVSPTSFTISFGATQATVTWNGASALPVGAQVIIEFDRLNPSFRRDPNRNKLPSVSRVERMYSRLLTLGNPAAGSANAISVSAAVAAGASAVLTASPYVMDAPRNVVGAWTTSSTVTVTGLDEYNNVVVEAQTGTAFTGVKAFAKVTSIVSSASITGATFGTGNVLGLPIYIPATTAVIKEYQDGATATAGTTVAGLSPQTKSTAATADVRGTYAPNATPDGSKVFEIQVDVTDPDFLGNPQFAG